MPVIRLEDTVTSLAAPDISPSQYLISKNSKKTIIEYGIKALNFLFIVTTPIINLYLKIKYT